MNQAVRDWFSQEHHSPTVLNVFTVSMIVSETESQDEGNMFGTEKLKYAKSIYSDIVNILVKDEKINRLKGNFLIDEYNIMINDGIIDEFSIIVSVLTNQPNLINMGKWIRDNRCGRVRNKCFPCKIVSNIKK